MALRKRSPRTGAPPRFEPLRFEEALAGERLVGIGYRCWLAGYDTRDISCWEVAWNYYARELGTAGAKLAVSELGCWVRAVRGSACRRLDYYPYGCRRFCRDECLAISMIAAGQNRACPALRACAYALIGASAVDSVVERANEFAHVLDSIGVRLSSGSVMDAAELLASDGDTVH